jgi:preprotein translocase subunit SecE
MAKAAVLTTTPESPHESPLTRGRNFLTEVRGEMRKVTSPSRAEVQSTTPVVILAVFIFAAFFYVVDTILNYVLQILLHWLGGA